MKKFIRVTFSIALIIVLFNFLGWILGKEMELIAEWPLIWFSITFVISFFVIVVLGNFLSRIAILPVHSIKNKLFLGKYFIWVASWAMTIIGCGAIVHYIDFTITKLCIYGVVAIIAYIYVAITINKMIEPGYDRKLTTEEEAALQNLKNYGYDSIEIATKITNMIKEEKVTYSEAIKQVEQLRESNIINEFQMTLIKTTIQSNFSNETTH